jgi:hypothetical protein
VRLAPSGIPAHSPISNRRRSRGWRDANYG